MSKKSTNRDRPAYKRLVTNPLADGITAALARTQARERVQREDAARVAVGPNNPSTKE